MQLQTTSPESKFPNEYSDNFHSNRSTFEKVIAKIQRGPDFMKHSVVSGNIRLMRIFAGVPGEGASTVI